MTVPPLELEDAASQLTQWQGWHGPCLCQRCSGVPGPPAQSGAVSPVRRAASRRMLASEADLHRHARSFGHGVMVSVPLTEEGEDPFSAAGARAQTPHCQRCQSSSICIPSTRPHAGSRSRSRTIRVCRFWLEGLVLPRTYRQFLLEDSVRGACRGHRMRQNSALVTAPLLLLLHRRACICSTGTGPHSDASSATR